MKIKFQIIALFFVSLALLNAQEDALPSSKSSKSSSSAFKDVSPELKQKAQKFFNTLLDTKISEAYDELLKGSPIKKKVEDVKSLNSQTKRAFELYGNIIGYEPVNAEFVTPSYLRMRYLALHSRYPMRWIFTFYKSPDQGWIITNVKFDDLTDYFFSDE